MKGISLTQPWASLIALGAKTIETRDWGTTYRGPLAIHAAKCTADFLEEYLVELCQQEPFRTGLGGRAFADLPRGAVVAVVRLIGCRTAAEVRRTITDSERAFGGYADGRTAWLLDSLRALDEPVPCRGLPGLWTVPPMVDSLVQVQLAGKLVAHVARPGRLQQEMLL